MPARKARAFEVYQQQAQNTEAGRQACEIRLRAERKCGQLLREREKAKGGAQPGVGRRGAAGMQSDGPTALSDLGISKQQSSDWQKLAEVPDDDFEAILSKPGQKPIIAGIIAAHTEPKQSPVDPNALWLWGRLNDFVREGLLDEHPEDLIGTMLPHMQVTTRELAPQVAAWLGEQAGYVVVIETAVRPKDAELAMIGRGPPAARPPRRCESHRHRDQVPR
jgi:hypothetical protein